MQVQDEAELQWKAHRGGRRQRAQASQALQSSVQASGRRFDSDLAAYLIQEWSWGHLSAPQVQKLAQLALQDQRSMLSQLNAGQTFVSSSLQSLAGLGTCGDNPCNIDRDLKIYLGEANLPKPFVVQVHVVVQKQFALKAALQTADFPFLLPHECFHHLYHNHQDAFNKLMLGGDAARVPDFWQGVVQRRDPRIAFHSVTKRSGWLQHAVPVSFHGDAVPCIAVGKAGTKSLDVWSWQSVLACVGSSLQLKNYICSVFQQSKAKPVRDGFDTEKELGEVVLWSLRQLYLGIWPSCDHRGVAYESNSAEGSLAGQPLAGGYFGVVWLIKGDLDYVANYLHLRHYAANEPCDLCPCHKTKDATWWPSNFGATSSWIPRIYTASDWKNLYPESPHWIFELEHVTNLNLEPDELHVMHLGTSMYLLGSVLWMFVYQIFRSSAATNMNVLWIEIVAAYRELRPPSQYTNINLASFCNPQQPAAHYPKLKGKGAEVKALVPVMRSILAKHMDPCSDEHRHMAAALHHQCEAQDIIDNFAHEWFLPPAKAVELKRHIFILLKNYTALGQIADAEGKLLWNMTPKFHWLYHFGERAQFLSPRRGACLIDEDYVGKIKTIGQACASGTPLHKMPSRIVEKMRWGKSILNSQA